MVWCNWWRVNRTFVFENNLRGDAYEKFLRNELPGLLEDIPLKVRSQMYFQHDGAPPHYSRLVREYLHVSFPSRWLGRLGPVAWPPRSPDLTLLDYYIWGHMKTLVYEKKVDCRADERSDFCSGRTNTKPSGQNCFSHSITVDTCWKVPSKWRWTLWTATLKQILWDKCTIIT